MADHRLDHVALRQFAARLVVALKLARHLVGHRHAARGALGLRRANDALDGLQPAIIVRTLGDEGVGRLLDGMYQIAPRTTAHAHIDLSPAQMRDALDRLGFTQPRAAPPVDMDPLLFAGHS